MPWSQETEMTFSQFQQGMRALDKHLGECEQLRESTERRMQKIEDKLDANTKMTIAVLGTACMQLLLLSGWLAAHILKL